MAGIYIHIPFCKQACSYCDFHFSTKLNNKTELINSILSELILRKGYLSENIDSIYFGGGTPSLLESREINLIIERISKHYDLSEEIEITLESNPDDLTKSYLIALQETPINRLSIGIQSFDDEDLNFMNRAHNSNEAIRSLKQAQDVGFENLTIDLIFGSPTSNKRKWEKNLDTFFSFDIPHLSSYSLTVEKGTKLYHDVVKQKKYSLNDQIALEQYQLLQERIDANNYEQYEVSNYCKNESYAIHNTSYWKGIRYLGIGPSAHSFDGISRQWNVSNNHTYIRNLKNGLEYFEREVLKEEDRYLEFLITGLRTKWGVSITKMQELFSSGIYNHFMKELEEIKDRFTIDENSIRLKRNLLFESDNTIRDLML